MQAVRNHAAVAIVHARIPDAPPAGALRGLNRALAAAPPIRELAWAHGAVVASARRHGATGDRIAAWLAEAVAGLLSDPGCWG